MEGYRYAPDHELLSRLSEEELGLMTQEEMPVIRVQEPVRTDQGEAR